MKTREDHERITNITTRNSLGAKNSEQLSFFMKNDYLSLQDTHSKFNILKIEKKISNYPKVED